MFILKNLVNPVYVLLKRIALRWLFMIVNRVQQPTHDQIQHRDAMTYPNTHRIGPRPETRLRLERGAAFLIRVIRVFLIDNTSTSAYYIGARYS